MNTVTIFTKGQSQGNPGPAVIAVSITNKDNTGRHEFVESIGNAKDDFAEYHAVLRGLQTAQEIFGEKTNELHFTLNLESEGVKKQLNAEARINEPSLVPYFIEIHNLRVSSFPRLTFTLVVAGEHKAISRLLNEATAS